MYEKLTVAYACIHVAGLQQKSKENYQAKQCVPAGALEAWLRRSYYTVFYRLHYILLLFLLDPVVDNLSCITCKTL